MKFRLNQILIIVLLLLKYNLYSQSIVDDGNVLFQKIKSAEINLDNVKTYFNKFDLNSKEYRTILYLEALIAEDNSELKKAEEILKSLVQSLNKKSEIDHVDYLKVQFKLGLVYQQYNYLEKAINHFENLKSDFNYSERSSDLYCSVVQEQANCYSDLFNFSRANNLFNEVYLIRNKNKFFRKESYSYSKLIHDMALNLHRMGNFKESIKFNLECLEIRKKISGEKNKSYLMTLNNLASNYNALGNYDLAIKTNLNCLELRKSVVGQFHDDYLMSLNNLSTCYLKIGNYLESRKYLNQLISTLERNGKIYNEKYIVSLLNLSDTYDYQGQFGKSLEIRNTCVILNDSIGGTQSKLYSYIITKLSQSYLDLGMIEEAKIKMEECLLIRENQFGKDHILYSETLNNLSRLYLELGDFEMSRTLLEESIKIRKRKTGKKHIDYAHELSQISHILAYQMNYKKAILFSKRSLKISRKIGSQEKIIASIYNDLGYYHTRCGKLSKARKNLEKSIKIHSKVNSGFYPFDPTAVGNLSIVYFLERKIDDFFKMETTILDNLKSQFLENEFYLNLDQKISLKNELSSRLLAVFNGIINNENQSRHLSMLSQYWFDLNSIIANSENDIFNYIYNSNDSELHEYYENYINAQKLYSFYMEKTNDELINSEIDIDRLKINSSIARKQLLSKLHVRDSTKLSSKEISSNLITNELYVDIVKVPKYSYRQNKWNESSNYIIFYISANDTNVNFQIIEGDLVEKDILSNYKIEVSEKRNASDLKNEIYYNSFWKPIADKIEDAKTVYVSLGGIYNNINLNTLYNPETGKYLIEEKDIRIVNSARDFVLMKEREKKQYTSTTSALYGFPDYNGNTTSSVDTIDYFALTRDLDQQWIDSLTRGGMKASPLPSTKVEVDQIASTFQKNGWNVKTNTGMAASEGNIKQEESPRVLHIATHGYFFEDIPLDKTSDRFLGMDRQRVVQDPMLRSGLLMTGANKTLQGEEMKGENGLLSAAEASLIDLRETELVVLSACETGKGEVKNSEGVYGLRKAFSDAGARNIMMSLWKVDDKVTQEFMSRFYEIWLNEKTSIREAFNRTQLEIKAKYPQPFYWGAFILVGE